MLERRKVWNALRAGHRACDVVIHLPKFSLDRTIFNLRPRIGSANAESQIAYVKEPEHRLRGVIAEDRFSPDVSVGSSGGKLPLHSVADLWMTAFGQALDLTLSAISSLSGIHLQSSRSRRILLAWDKPLAHLA